MKNKHSLPALMVLPVVLLLAANLLFGSVSVPLPAVCDALLGRATDPAWRFIVVESRLPQALTALLCGASLAASGLLLQTVFANPLADTSILGVNSGAGLGVAVALLLWGGSLTTATFSLSGFVLIVAAALAGALAVIGLLLFCSRLLQSNLMLLITGIMVSYITSSVISLLNFAATAEGVHSYIMWGMGSFGGVAADRLLPFALVCLGGMVWALCLVKPLNALLLGEHYAANLGVRVGRVRTQLLLVTGLLSAITTAFCGPVSFIGLAVPHMARLLSGSSDHRVLLPLTLLIGGGVALACNLLTTLPGDNGVLPLNAITALWGVPVVLYILFRQRGNQSFL